MPTSLKAWLGLRFTFTRILFYICYQENYSTSCFDKVLVKVNRMQSEFYPFTPANDDDGLVFYFESVSDRKTIRKVIAYRRLFESAEIYNLALADEEPDGSLSDLMVSNNSDMPKVLATVVQSLSEFLKYRPDATVYFKGSTSVRTRLYQIVISRELSKTEKYFEIYGVLGTKTELFVQNRCYEAFLIKNKKA
jgi:hypothetical protein